MVYICLIKIAPFDIFKIKIKIANVLIRRSFPIGGIPLESCQGFHL